MKRFRDRYTDAIWGPNALRPNEVLVALAYAKYAGAKDPTTGERAPDDVAWVTWPTLSEMTGIRSKDALNRATRALVEAGWIHQIERRQQHRSPRYRLTIPTNPEVRLAVVCDETEEDPSGTPPVPLRGTRNGQQHPLVTHPEVREPTSRGTPHGPDT